MIYDLFDYSDRCAGEERRPFIDLPYIHTLCQSLEDCVAGCLPEGRQNLICCIAPRHYKTSFGARNFPAWCLAEIAPDCEFILTSYSQNLVTDSAMSIKARMNTPWHMDLYPHLRVSRSDRDLQDYFRTTAGGSVYAAPIGGVITGFGAGKPRKGFGGAIIFDDTLKAADVSSETMRNRVIEYFNGTLKSRRNSIHNTPIIVIAQRLHPDDLIGWILQNEPEDWHVVSFPAQGDDGDPLNPVTTSRDFLSKLKDVAPHVYWSQYMQSPIIQGGNIIKTEWWRTFDASAHGGHTGLVFLTADTAYKAKKESDRSVIRAWEGTRDHLYCLDAVYGRWEFPRLLDEARGFWEKWRQRGAREFWVEDKATGTPLAQTLRDNGIPAQDWRPGDFDFPDDKVGRMNEAAWSVHGGHVLVPEGKEDVRAGGGSGKILRTDAQSKAMIEECAAFLPDMSHKNDDHCDTLTMGISLWRSAGGGRQDNGKK